MPDKSINNFGGATNCLKNTKMMVDNFDAVNQCLNLLVEGFKDLAARLDDLEEKLNIALLTLTKEDEPIQTMTATSVPASADQPPNAEKDGFVMNWKLAGEIQKELEKQSSTPDLPSDEKWPEKAADRITHCHNLFHGNDYDIAKIIREEYNAAHESEARHE